MVRPEVDPQPPILPAWAGASALDLHRLLAVLRFVAYYWVLAYVHFLLVPRRVPNARARPGAAMNVQMRMVQRPNLERDIRPQIARAAAQKLRRRCR